MDADGELAHPGEEGRPLDADDVADVELLEQGERLVADLALADEELDLAGTVAQVGEDRLAHAAAGSQPSGDDHFGAVLALGRSDEFRTHLFDRNGIGEGVAVGIDPRGFQFPDLRLPLGEKGVDLLFPGFGVGCGIVADFFTHFL